MMKVNVLFYFETQEQWLDFGKKFFNHKEFEQDSPIWKGLKERNQIFEQVVNEVFNTAENEEKKIHINNIFFQSIVYFSTKSEKRLKNLYKFIKENHYENKYGIRDNWGNRFYMDLDGLLEWWSEVKNQKTKRNN